MGDHDSYSDARFLQDHATKAPTHLCKPAESAVGDSKTDLPLASWLEEAWRFQGRCFGSRCEQEGEREAIGDHRENAGLCLPWRQGPRDEAG